MATEKFANAAASTLNGGITNVALSLIVTSATPFPVSGQFRIIIESEIIIATVVAGATFSIIRGQENTAAAAHANGVAVTLVLTAGSVARNPRSMTTTGDIEYLDANGAPARLAAPADGAYDLTFTAGIPSYALLPSATKLASKASNSVNQNIATGVSTILTFDTNSFDYGAIHSVTVNKTRFTVPIGGAGIWIIVGQWLSSPAGVGNQYQIRIIKNGSLTGIAFNELQYVPGSEIILQVSAIDNAIDGDYYEFLTFQNSGVNQVAFAGAPYTFGSIARIVAA